MTKKSFAIRAAAILTTSEVNGTTFPLDKTSDDRSCTIDVRHTHGSLDTASYRFYVAMTDNSSTTWVPYSVAEGRSRLNFAADGNFSVKVDAPGWKYLRVSAIGYGTATSSSGTVTARYV